MNVIITCGPAYEPIDQARRITNFSTGRLGIHLANSFTARGWNVVCLKGENATCPDPINAATAEPFSTNDDLAHRLQRLAREQRIDAVFHAAALCDFRVARIENEVGDTVSAAKLSSRSGELVLHLAPATKLLPSLRAWFPQAFIAGWKYELNGTRPDAFARAWNQLAETSIDCCILNGAAYGSGFAICHPDHHHDEITDSTALAARLADLLLSCQTHPKIG